MIDFGVGLMTVCFPCGFGWCRDDLLADTLDCFVLHAGCLSLIVGLHVSCVAFATGFVVRVEL